MKINMNQKVKVKLTNYGYKCLKEYAEDFYSSTFITSLYVEQVEEFVGRHRNKEDIEGYIEFQVWELFQYFGDFHHLGMPNVVFQNNEIIITED